MMSALPSLLRRCLVTMAAYTVCAWLSASQLNHRCSLMVVCGTKDGSAEHALADLRKSGVDYSLSEQISKIGSKRRIFNGKHFPSSFLCLVLRVSPSPHRPSKGEVALATSYIFQSAATGSRTIFHHSTQPEISLEHFRKVLKFEQTGALDLKDFDWVRKKRRRDRLPLPLTLLLVQFLMSFGFVLS